MEKYKYKIYISPKMKQVLKYMSYIISNLIQKVNLKCYLIKMNSILCDVA